MERFYRDLLGLPVVGEWDDGTALRIGAGVLLLFDRGRLADRDEPLAAHGASGPGHVCLVAAPGEYDSWKLRLHEDGVELTHEQAWNADLRSFYFNDPAGNLLEIAEADMWPSRGSSRTGGV
jgi:catechol 2,3-dioxygenase-like lactoylglutathione lyase family enzyme